MSEQEIRCANCGRSPELADGAGERTSEIPWTWSVVSEGQDRQYLCADCTREHARSIEAKLDHEWW